MATDLGADDFLVKPVDFEDLNLVVSNFNTDEAWLDGDVDGDGDIDFADLNLVISGFNTNCD